MHPTWRREDGILKKKKRKKNVPINTDKITRQKIILRDLLFLLNWCHVYRVCNICWFSVTLSLMLFQIYFFIEMSSSLNTNIFTFLLSSEFLNLFFKTTSSFTAAWSSIEFLTLLLVTSKYCTQGHLYCQVVVPCDNMCQVKKNKSQQNKTEKHWKLSTCICLHLSKIHLNFQMDILVQKHYHSVLVSMYKNIISLF